MGELMRVLMTGAGDVRTLRVEAVPRGILMREQMCGELTRVIFDVDAYTHELFIKYAEYEALCTLLSVENEASEAEVEEALWRQQLYLTDIMDLLDREGIPYRYSSSLVNKDGG